jgi:hypothetical protein
MSGSTQQKPLTALEWLRVTHAGTLSGRRIEEAVATARDEGYRAAVEESRQFCARSGGCI